jgi:U3 small nucleolar RNA-associated protein 14
VTLQSSETERPAQISSPVSNQTLRSEASNPWLVQGAGSSSKVSRKKNNVVLGKDSTSADKSKNAIRKQLKKTAEAKEMELDDATVDISMENVLRIVDAEGATPTLGGASKLKRKEPIDSNNTVDSAYQDSGDEGSEVEELMTSRKGNKAFEQKELVALAFAGDNVVEVCCSNLCRKSS